MSAVCAQLAGEETLIGSWAALASDSPGAYLTHTRTSVAAVFPSWKPLNNAILLHSPSNALASETAAELLEVYRSDGVTSWALWVPTPDLDLDAPDVVTAVDGMARDDSTLVMTRELSDEMPSCPGVLRTTVEIASRAGDEPITVDALPDPLGDNDIEGWVLVYDEYAVVGAWTFRNGSDVGIYAVGTAPDWRRRGLARGLMMHVLADAYRRGARTASLQSTRMGEPLYAGLGFRAVGRYDEWVPQEDQAG